MRLTDLQPLLINIGTRTGVGLAFNCPKCGGDSDRQYCGGVFVHFENPIDGGPAPETSAPRWTRTGDTFETMTLRPSILKPESKAGCGWHGYVTDGEVSTL